MKALLLGGTGAIGGYLQEELAATGWEVLVTSRSARSSRNNVSFVLGNAQDLGFLEDVLNGRFDAVVDFMTWPQDKFTRIIDLILSSTARYVFLSSYRVFADAPVLTEDSPRLLEVCPDEKYRLGDEYAIKKAREEDILRKSGKNNWTIARPAITFSGEGLGRFQLGTYEKDIWLWRALNGRPIPLVPEMMERQCTLTWAGDVAKMIARLIVSPEAAGEAFNVSTAQHQTWGEVLNIYRAVLPIETYPVTLEQYESHCGRALKEYGYIPQVRYDRMLNRVIDNTKALSACGLDRSDLSEISEVLPRELRRYLNATLRFDVHPAIQGRLDRIIDSSMSLSGIVRAGFGVVGSMKYFVGRLGLG